MGRWHRALLGAVVTLFAVVVGGLGIGRCSGVSLGPDLPGQVPEHVRAAGDPAWERLDAGSVLVGDALTGALEEEGE